jgi:hypothetical protein
MKQIKVNSSVEDRVEYKTIKIIQGNLKDLLSEDYLKFKENVLKHGFVDPIDVWVEPSGELSSLGGTQRIRMLTALENEGYSIPPIPINRIQAETKTEAKKIILSLASQYGRFNNEGVLEFVSDMGFSDLSEVADAFRLAEVSFDDIAEEFGKDGTDKLEKGSLADKFGAPPFSVLNAREGWWQERKRQWIDRGIESELGRGVGGNDSELQKPRKTLGATPPNQKDLYKKMRNK